MGDRTTANAVRIDHVYNTAGIFNVVLTVTDDQGLQGTTNHQIEITAVEPEQPSEPPGEESNTEGGE
jgi:PKD repeat protein